MLKPNGVCIAGANYQTPPFDGPFKEISAIDKKMERILKCGFELKERIYVENEYVVYTFSKVEK
jgi:hypothetical protein